MAHSLFLHPPFALTKPLFLYIACPEWSRDESNETIISKYSLRGRGAPASSSCAARQPGVRSTFESSCFASRWRFLELHEPGGFTGVVPRPGFTVQHAAQPAVQLRGSSALKNQRERESEREGARRCFLRILLSIFLSIPSISY